MNMNKMKSKLMLAGVLAACAFGGIAIGIAWATPGEGLESVLLAGPATLDELDIGGESDTHEIELKTRGEWQSRVVAFRIAPGGQGGWHSHPGPAFVMITKGTMTLYQADDIENPGVYPAGTGVVEDVGRVHNPRNEEDGDLEFVVFFLTPRGAPVRINEPAP